jgi:hypothetical protein
MASWREIDFRYDWVYSVLSALKSGFDEIEKRGQEQEWFDGLWQLESSEVIFGIALVTVQTYIEGTAADIIKMRKSSGKPKIALPEYYEDDPNPLPSGINRVKLIRQAANYHKHHDLWNENDWGKRNNDTDLLKSIGINEKTEFPCYETTRILLGDDNSTKLEKLLLIASEWREHVISKYK